MGLRLKKDAKLIIILATFLFFGTVGCATLFTGTNQTVTFDSEPQGATVLINGATIGTTPVTTQIQKQKVGQNTTTVTFEKEGFKKQTILLSTAIEGWFWGNIISGGVWGSTTDAVTGAMYQYSPNQYYATLKSDSSGTAKIYDSEKAKVKEFIVVSYRNIMEDLAKGGGNYLSSESVQL